MFHMWSYNSLYHVIFPYNVHTLYISFDVFLTVDLSIFISVIYQLDAQNLW